MMEGLRDLRALGMPDVPYSAYCKVCWQNIYCMWIDKEPHDGSCLEGAMKIEDCKQAMNWERTVGAIKSYVASEQIGEA